jgi:hypothetical protein
VDRCDRYEINGSKTVYDTIDGEVLLINVETGNYYQLPEVGTDVWHCLEAGMDVAQIASRLAARYDGAAPAEIESSIGRFIAQLVEEGLVVHAPADGREAPASAVGPAEPEVGPARRPFSAPVLHKHTDLQGLLLVDPIHDVDEQGWPAIAPRNDSAQ